VWHIRRIGYFERKAWNLFNLITGGIVHFTMTEYMNTDKRLLDAIALYSSEKSKIDEEQRGDNE